MSSAAIGPPRPVFDHLARLSDERGLFEHALRDSPRLEHGYCVDDVARGLVVVSREPRPDPVLRRLTRLYLDFVLCALDDDGACRNRMSAAGVWQDEPSLGDWWGRAVWGLGVAAAGAPTPYVRARALCGFRVAAQRRSPHNRAMAFAALGAGRLLQASPEEQSAEHLVRDCAVLLSAASPDDAWLWPEPRLRYANAAVAHALILAGDTLDERALLDRGLELLGFLLGLETVDDHLSVTAAGGRAPGEVGPAFDQQPIEVAAMAEACAAAYAATNQPRWHDAVALCWGWFLGNNDSRTEMFDGATGGGYDGLEPTGRNQNQGAESTLAMLATAQQAQRVRGRR
ncbi:glycosyltransferase [uncultured Jatrophihabitans sp.]|uniref:glycosyltransferase n=1 Tax=uncultured Jatrophihabitans sp. TaxID=1610747 RepID=UPI0035CAFA29